MKFLLNLLIIININLTIAQIDTNNMFNDDEKFLIQFENVVNNQSLNQYEIDSCLVMVLRRTITNDSSCYFYIKDKSAYSFGVSNRDSIFYIKITPIYLHHITQNNGYKGYFEAYNRKFLLYGKISNDILKKHEGNKIEIEYYKGKDIIDSYILNDIDIFQIKHICNDKTFIITYVPFNCYSPEKKTYKSKHKRRMKR